MIAGDVMELLVMLEVLKGPSQTEVLVRNTLCEAIVKPLPEGNKSIINRFMVIYIEETPTVKTFT